MEEELTEVVVSGMTEAQTSSLSTALTTAGNSVLSNFVSIIPAVAGIVAIAFVIYFVTKQLNKLKRGR